jgi:CDP-diacylglycerol pyrophosphatase
LLAALASLAPIASVAGGEGALWRVVHDLCLADARLSGHPAPCSKVDQDRGYAVLKDLEYPTHFILVPTARVTGIEDPKLLTPDSPNYWALSWENRHLLERRIGRPLPREAIGLAVNSVYGRSQDQLHVHIDCVRPDVARSLAAERDRIGPQWRRLDANLAGRHYLVRWMPEQDLAANDPFKLLAEMPSARAEMGRQALALIGAVSATGRPGFLLLDEGDDGHSEALLDHACRLSSEATASPQEP